MTSATIMLLAVATFAALATGHVRPATLRVGASPLRSCAPRVASAPLLSAIDEKERTEELEVWRLREGMVRGLYGVVVNWKEFRSVVGALSGDYTALRAASAVWCVKLVWVKKKFAPRPSKAVR